MKRLTKTFEYCCIVCFYCVFIIASATIINQSYLAGFLAIPAAALCIYAYKKIILCHRRLPGPFHATAIWCVLQAFSTLFMLTAVKQLEVGYSWDWGQLLESATHYVLNGEVDNVAYYARCNNNQPWLVVLIAFFKGIKWLFPGAQTELFKQASVVFSVVSVQLTLLFIYLTARLLWAPRTALLAGMTAIGCLPFYLYAQYAYTDTPIMMLLALTVYLYIRAKKSSNTVLFSLLIGIVGGLVFKIKIMGFILFIALAIDVLLFTKGVKNILIRLLPCVLSGVAVAVAFGAITTATLKINPTMEESTKQPPTHFVMMGLKGSGGFNWDDVHLTASFDTYEEKVAGNLQEIKSRLSEKGVQGTLEHIFLTKLSRTWGESLLGSDYYLCTEPLKENGIFYRLFTAKGDLHWICLLYSGTFHLLLLAGLLLSGLLSAKEEQPKLLFGRLALVGIAVFLSIWECNSRYLLIYLPILLLLAFDGWSALTSRLLRKRLDKAISSTSA